MYDAALGESFAASLRSVETGEAESFEHAANPIADAMTSASALRGVPIVRSGEGVLMERLYPRRIEGSIRMIT